MRSLHDLEAARTVPSHCVKSEAIRSTVQRSPNHYTHTICYSNVPSKFSNYIHLLYQIGRHALERRHFNTKLCLMLKRF